MNSGACEKSTAPKTQRTRSRRPSALAEAERIRRGSGTPQVSHGAPRSLPSESSTCRAAFIMEAAPCFPDFPPMSGRAPSLTGERLGGARGREALAGGTRPPRRGPERPGAAHRLRRVEREAARRASLPCLSVPAASAMNRAPLVRTLWRNTGPRIETMNTQRTKPNPPTSRDSRAARFPMNQLPSAAWLAATCAAVTPDVVIELH